MDLFQQLSTQVRQIWRGMSVPRRFFVAVVALLSVASIGGVAYWSSQADYQPLFAGLAPEDAGAVTQKLQSLGISHRLSAGGTTVLVPAEQVQQLRVALAVEGLPAKGAKGFELFDQTSFGMSPFTQHVNYLRALQGELAKTIAQIDPVVQARVHIVRPEPSPFLRDQKPTTASVMLKLRPGATLARNTSAGIAALVARSVEGLTRENVTLIDQSGRLLWQDRGDDGVMATQIEYRRDLESYLASKAETMLAQVLGPGRAIVRVTADVNLRQHRERKETYQPENRVATMEKTQTTKTTSSGGAKGGASGTGSNLGKANQGGPSSSSNNIEETIQTDYVVSKTTQELENRVGAIERLTIAALVDLAPPGDADGKAAPAMALADVQDIIKKAVGFKSDRDEIKVTQVRLPESSVGSPASEAEVAGEPAWQKSLNAVRNVSLAFAGLVACVLGITLVRRLRASPAPRPAPVPAEETPDVISLRRLSQVLEKNPEALAKVLENWLNQPGKPPAAAA